MNKLTYLRIDSLVLLNYPRLCDWLAQQSDAEYRDDYQCWFIQKGTKTHTWLSVTYPEVLRYSV